MSGMQVVDIERSERGLQRRRDQRGRLLHSCCICGQLDRWSNGWSTYCSWKEIDDEVPIPKFCSDACRAKGGVAARNVTSEMKKIAKDAEWRDPKIVYRAATASEKYAEAKHLQRNYEGESQ